MTEMQQMSAIIVRLLNMVELTMHQNMATIRDLESRLELAMNPDATHKEKD